MGPTTPEGNILTTSAPISHAFNISVGVKAPGITTTEYLLQILIISLFVTGETTNSAPAKIELLAVSESRTVPAPNTMSSGLFLAISLINSIT